MKFLSHTKVAARRVHPTGKNARKLLKRKTKFFSENLSLRISGSILLLFFCSSSFLTAAVTSDAAAHLARGKVLGETGDMVSAAEEFKQALRLDAHLADAHYLLALTMVANPVDKLDWRSTAAECRSALADRPAYPEAAHLLGVALAAMGQRATAIEQFQKALLLRPNYPEAHLDLGMAYSNQGENDRAIAEFNLALASRPNYAEAHERLAKALLEQGKQSQAQQELLKALRINPDLTDAHYLLGRVYSASAKKEDAAIEFRQVAQLNSRRTLATESVRLSNTGLDAMRRGDISTAVANLREAVEKKPDSATAHFNFGLVLADTGQLDDGIAQVRKALSLAPASGKMRSTLTRMLERKGQSSNATVVLEDTSHRHTQNGDVFLASGDSLGAIGEYLRALSIDPANRGARAGLAAAWKKNGNQENWFLETQKLRFLQQTSEDSTGK
jgi:tetratricopeptide (TPR) repeat protein